MTFHQNSLVPNFTAIKQLAIFVLFFVLSVAATVYAQPKDSSAPGDPKDPFGGGGKLKPDPFGKKTVDPFGAADVKPADPLAGIEDPVARERAKKVLAAQKARNRMMAESFLSGGMETIGWVFIRSDDKRGHLEATLSLLHFEQFGRKSVTLPREPNLAVDAVRGIELFAKQEWKPDEGETRKQMFARIAKKNKEGRLHSAFPIAAEHYVRLTGKDWPLNWRRQHDFWINVADAIIESKSRENPATFWKLKIRADEKNSDLYRICYLATCRFAGAELFDETLIAPLIRDRMTASADDLVWQARTLEALVAVGLDKNDRRRVVFRNRFLKNLKEQPTKEPEIRGRRHLASKLGPLYRIADEEAEARPMLLAILNQRDPEEFQELANAIPLSSGEVFDWYMKKQVSASFTRSHLNTALAGLLRQVKIPTWIDDAVAKDETMVTLTTRGTWKEAVDAVLEKTPYRLASLDKDLFWIGNPMFRKQAVETVKQGLEKIPLDARHHRAADALREVASLDFVETPLSDALEYLEDFAGIEIELLDDHGEVPVTFSLQVPLHTFLTLTTSNLEIDWSISGEAVIVGTKEQIAAVRKRDDSRKVRLERIAALNRRMGAVLDEDTRLEFIETPLIDVSEYLGDRHEFNFYVSRDTPRDTTLTCDLTGNVAWALDFMLLPHELNWYSDGNLIYIGNEKAIEAFRKIADARDERRKKYPKDLADQLQAPAGIEFIETPLADVVKYLRKSTKVQINLDGEDDKFAELLITDMIKQPLDVTLDMLSLSHGLEWRLVNGSIHIKRIKMKAAE